MIIADDKPVRECMAILFLLYSYDFEAGELWHE